ncbi:PASTA domain-containing protein [Nocardioides mangrovi]|uniref:PASTA domain-containing protein n=1 Tax=Nocardioides mangrovi TaxID=2874580 RepID=A0ABS7UFG1_9ACTN|nr:PASTA domain-containing protein [Nocardioides mangrovi]MBZ5739589.1 PASTA domain-containing protein [Nocardioides mangrovi]
MRIPLVALVATAGLLLVACGGDSTEAEAPDGTRWVGSGRVVVAVPDWWTTGETRCLLPVEDTVYWDSGAVADCADVPARSEVREASTLAVLDAEHGYAEHLLTQMDPAGAVDGREVVELDGCDAWIPDVCRHVFAVPSEHVVLAVTIADEADGDYQEIRDSLRILPDGRTTVPLDIHGTTPTWGAEPAYVDHLTRALEDAGLQVEVATIPAEDLTPGSLLEVEPALGSVVDEGATVTVTVAG